MVRNLPAMQETQVHSLGCEDPLEKDSSSPSSFSPLQLRVKLNLYVCTLMQLELRVIW